ncbi:MAG TPA: hypothetical protein VH022_03500 [Candidatus Acidoferrum sp.]|nr:hypothetical protein [Candidatus Acidoferrum sp.]
MDELSSNLAGETTEMAPETAVNSTSELRKRRSTRIVQAVPLQVTGVDALGRPFMERTSSLILNCHGCRYQSKHYVLKNMWVKLEVPNPQEGEAPRTVRGRVAWIQRPRTVRQLFQVALELEAPGNVWGIAFPPEDWFAQSDSAAAESASAPIGTTTHLELPLPPLAPPPMPPSENSETEFHVSLTDSDAIPTASSASPAPPPANPDNVRVFPSPASTTDASLQLARHVTRLLAEARQQIQAAAREAASQAVGAERTASAEQWENKVAESRDNLQREVAAATEKLHEDSQSRSREAHEAAAAALQEELPKRLAPQLEEVARNLTSHLSDEGRAQRAAHSEQLTSAAESLSEVCQQAEETTARLLSASEQADQHISAQADALQKALGEAAAQREQLLSANRDSLTAAADETQQKTEAALAAALEKWRSDLGGEVESAQHRWQATVDTALASAQEVAAATVTERANALLSAFHQESDYHTTNLRTAAAEHGDKADRQAQTARELLQSQTERAEAAANRATETADRLEQLASRLETVQQHALNNFQSQADDALNLHRNELHRHSESVLEEINGRIRTAFDNSSREAVARFGEQVEGVLLPHVTRADEAMQRLAGGRSLLDAALSLHQDRIRSSTDEAFAEALQQFRSNLGGIEEVLRVTTESVTSRGMSDFEMRLEDLKQKTVEDLNKSAEWYEKRAQNQTQAAADKAGEQAAKQLREQAGNIANEFSGEIDQSSRNFVAYAQTQMADVVSEAFDRARSLFSEAAETTTAAFIDEIQQHARRDLDGFESELKRSTSETRSLIDTAHSELAQRVTLEQENFLRRFQDSLHGTIEAGVAEAHERVQAGFRPVIESWKAMTAAQQDELQSSYARIGDQAATQFRDRLDNVSNQWMLATVTSFDHQSRDSVSRVTAGAEEKLRETFTKVFADMGDALRDRMREIASNLNVAATAAPTPSSEQAPLAEHGEAKTESGQ